MIETWVTIHEAPAYEVSNKGAVRKISNKRPISQRFHYEGSLVVSLRGDIRSKTYLVGRLVAMAFLDDPLSPAWNTVVHLDGDQENNWADNLGWRTRSIAWYYKRQFESPPPAYLYTPVENDNTGMRFDSCIEAGLYDGVVWEHVYRSSLLKVHTMPYGHTYSAR